MLRRDADAGVAHPQHGLVAVARQRVSRDLAARVGVLGGVGQQVADDLRQAHRVGVDQQRLGRQRHDLELCAGAPRSSGRPVSTAGATTVAQFDALLAQLDLAAA